MSTIRTLFATEYVPHHERIRAATVADVGMMRALKPGESAHDAHHNLACDYAHALGYRFGCLEALADPVHPNRMIWIINVAILPSYESC